MTLTRKDLIQRLRELVQAHKDAGKYDGQFFANISYGDNESIELPLGKWSFGNSEEREEVRSVIAELGFTLTGEKCQVSFADETETLPANDHVFGKSKMYDSVIEMVKDTLPEDPAFVSELEKQIHDRKR